MKKIVNALLTVFTWIVRFLLARKNVAIRFVFTLFFVVVLVVLVFSILVLTVLQFLTLFLFVKHVDAIKSLSHMLTVYAYQVLRYITLNDNRKPFPFSGIPETMEPVAGTDLTNPLPPVMGPMSPDENLEATEAGGVEPDAEAGPDLKEKTSEPIILDYNEDRKQS